MAAGESVAADAAARSEGEDSARSESCLIGGQSFTADTKVLTASGALVAISKLKPGDKVLATSTKTGKTQAEPVAAVLVHYDKAAALKDGTHQRTPSGAAATVVGGWTPKVITGWMWDLTIPGNNDHDFYIQTNTSTVLVHYDSTGKCGEAAEAVQAKVADMKAAMTGAETGRTTYAAAHVTTWLGRDELWVASAGKDGFVRAELRGSAINMKFPAPSELSGLERINDAEVHLFRAAANQSATINAIGATRPVCILCQQRLPAEIPIVTELGQ